MRRSRATSIYADGCMQDRDEWERAQNLAIEISGADVQHCDARNPGPSGPGGIASV
jgi:hypothetical protein